MEKLGLFDNLQAVHAPKMTEEQIIAHISTCKKTYGENYAFVKDSIEGRITGYRLDWATCTGVWPGNILDPTVEAIKNPMKRYFLRRKAAREVCAICGHVRWYHLVKNAGGVRCVKFLGAPVSLDQCKCETDKNSFSVKV